MTAVRAQACSACPYRRDCPSGLWQEHEYDKLPPYDAPTGDQPLAPFMCHATPDHYCHGWAVVHSGRGHDHDLLALRLFGCPSIPPPNTPLFESGAEAAEHGKRDVDAPSDDAVKTMERLVRIHPRLREGNQ
jgi:Family of unknown function (DUF6283)